jgi:isopentenyldiphosphate isomerase
MDPVEPLNELIRCFNEQGEEIEPHTRLEVHALPLKYWHATTAIHVVNKKGELLCSKRSLKLDQKPGCWQTCFGGHVNAGQTYEEGALKELKEESGIEASLNELIYIDDYKSLENKHFGKAFTYILEGGLENINFTDGEVTEVKWIDMAKAWQEKLENPENWVATCPPQRQEKIKKVLKEKLG